MSIFTKLIGWFFVDSAVQQADCDHDWEAWSEPHIMNDNIYALWQDRSCSYCNMQQSHQCWSSAQ